MAALQEFVKLRGLVCGYQVSRALAVVADLGIADLLREGELPIEALAASAGAQVGPLYRVMRALASIGVFREAEGRRFALSDLGELLRTDHPLSLAATARMFGADYQWKAWGELQHTVRTGENGATAALGMDVWAWRREHPRDNTVFNEAMRSFSSVESGALLAGYSFGRYPTIADIGGGTGANLAAILAACPHSRGILFDLPHVVAEAAPVLTAAGVAQRVEVVSGNFFEAVPAGADAYVLRRVLHDWEDPEAISILRCIRGCMRPDSRILILEGVVGPPNEDVPTKFLDLMMLVSAGGRERTAEEWAALLSAAGLALERATPVTPSLSVIEGVQA